MDLRRWLTGKRPADAQVALDRAVAAVDRELAADLELMTMFDQTKQAVVLEIGQFADHADVLLREAASAHGEAADLYGRVALVEAAMERRGPANSLRDEDRLVIERWEGDARHVQRALRAAARAPATPVWRRLTARLRGRPPRE